MKTTGTHKILIVDDNPDDRFVINRALSKSGFELEVETAAHGEGALELLRKEDDLPSVIFLDLKMPGMSGIETLRHIRDDVRLSKIPVILVTHSLLELDKKESYDAGADGLINKVSDIERFGRDIESVLERWLKE
jgi:two-component system, response regulator